MTEYHHYKITKQSTRKKMLIINSKFKILKQLLIKRFSINKFRKLTQKLINLLNQINVNYFLIFFDLKYKKKKWKILWTKYLKEIKIIYIKL